MTALEDYNPRVPTIESLHDYFPQIVLQFHLTLHPSRLAGICSVCQLPIVQSDLSDIVTMFETNHLQLPDGNVAIWQNSHEVHCHTGCAARIRHLINRNQQYRKCRDLIQATSYPPQCPN